MSDAVAETSAGRSWVHRLPLILLRVVLGLVFLQAAFSKAWRTSYEIETVYDAWFRPGSAAHWAFVAVEVLLGLWLIVGWRIRFSAAVAMLMLLGFIGILGYEVVQTDPRLCGCGLVSVEPESVRASLWQAIAFDFLFLFAALWLFVQSGPRRPALRTPVEPAPS